MDIVINEVTYSLPCREFMIDYSVSQKRQLPVVKEFIVRFLFIMNTCDPAEIGNYFGLSDSELKAVLLDLQEEKLIKWVEEEEGVVSLTGYALERFENVDGKAMPRFFEVDDQFDSVKFDLHSFRVIPKRFSGEYKPNNIEIKPAADAFSNTTSKIESAFNQQFYSFLEKVKGVDIFNDPKELYKINEIQIKREFLMPVKVSYFLDTEDSSHPFMDLEEDVQEWDEDNMVLSAINKSLNEGSTPATSQVNQLKAYLQSTLDPVLSNFFSDDGLDINSLLSSYEHQNRVYSQNGRMLVGNLYTDDNAKLFTELLKQAGFDKAHKIRSKGAAWLVDANSKMWGRCPELEKFAYNLLEQFDDRRKPSITLCMNVDSTQEAIALRDRYQSPSVKLQGVTESFCNSETEVFIIPGVLVACLFHKADSNFGSLSLPFGYVTTDESQVDALQEKIWGWLNSPRSTNNYFERRDVDEKDSVRTKYLEKVLRPTTNNR